MSDILRLSTPENDDRFARFELIGWWDQRRLAEARVVLIGVGALGNEILKNLAMLGVGNVFVADFDLIENSNLSRSVLFRAEDCGQPKSEVAARRAADIYPDIRIQPFSGNIVYNLGLGVYRWPTSSWAGWIIAKRAWRSTAPLLGRARSGSTEPSSVWTGSPACSIRPTARATNAR